MYYILLGMSHSVRRCRKLSFLLSSLFFIIYVTIVLALETVESVWKIGNDVDGRRRNIIGFV
jgi:hypothetical protein